MDLATLQRFCFLTLPNYSSIACANAIEVLRMASRLIGAPVYAWEVATVDGQPAAASNGRSPRHLERGRTLLRETAMPVTAVAGSCGYSTPSRFSAAYRSRFGQTPSEERRAAGAPPGRRPHDAHRSHPA